MEQDFNFSQRDRPDDWRPWPSNDFGPRLMTTKLGEITPLRTNGILVIGIVNGHEFTAHITNVPKIVKENFSSAKPMSTKPKKPTIKQKLMALMDDILA